MGDVLFASLRVSKLQKLEKRVCFANSSIMEDLTFGQLDLWTTRLMTTRLTDNSTHGQVDSLTSRPIVIIHVLSIFF